MDEEAQGAKTKGIYIVGGFLAIAAMLGSAFDPRRRRSDPNFGPAKPPKIALAEQAARKNRPISRPTKKPRSAAALRRADLGRRGPRP